MIELEKQPVLLTLQIMIESCFFSCEDVRRWATHIVSRTANPQAWLIELACAKNAQEALQIVVRTRSQPLRVLTNGQNSFRSEMSKECALDEQLYIGFSYLRYRRGDIGTREFEDDVSDVTNPDFDTEWGLDELRMILNDTQASATQVSSKIKSRFGHFGEKAEKAQAYIESAVCLQEHIDLFEYRD